MKHSLVFGSMLVLALMLSSCRTKEYSREATADSTAIQTTRHEAMSSQNKPASPQRESSDSNAKTDDFMGEAVRNMGGDYRLLADQYYKAGDIRYSLSFSDGGAANPLPGNQLECFFVMPGLLSSGGSQRYETATILTEEGETSYEIVPKGYEGDTDILTGDTAYTISIGRDAASALYVSIKGGGELEGDYYPLLRNCTYPSVFTRYLSKSDLCLWPTENLRLLRNEVYAAHGRKFKSENLNEYFSKFNWYRGTVEPEAFSDTVLSDLEKKNVDLIRQMEQDPQRLRPDGTNLLKLEDLTAAPYLSYLGLHEETGINADLTKAKDMGAYYVVQGEIYYPVSITQEQLRLVNEGGQAKVVLDELTGQTGILTLDTDEEAQPYHLYILYEGGQVSDDSDQGTETYLSKDYEHGVYSLMQDSDDTVMKAVYKGDIYILKDAVCGVSAGLEKASLHQSDIFPRATEGVRSTYAGDKLLGNRLFYNKKGYLTAVYYLGD